MTTSPAPTSPSDAGRDARTPAPAAAGEARVVDTGPPPPATAAGDAAVPSDPPVMDAGSDEQVVLPVCWLAVFEMSVIVPAILIGAGQGVVLVVVWQPRDVELVAELLTAYPFGWLALWVVVAVPLRLAAVRPMIWRASGIRLAGEPTPLPWSQVTAIDVRWRALRGRTVVVARRNGADIPVRQPRGAAWLPDPRFDRAVAGLRAWAAAHGGNPEPTGRYRTGPPRPLLVVAAAVASVLVVAVAVTTVWRGVIWPWEPTAAHVPDHCPTLPAALAGEGWTGPHRILDSAAGRLWCEWTRHRDLPAYQSWIDVQVQVHDGRPGPGGRIAEAVIAHRGDRRWAQAMHDSTRPIPWFGDDAFLSTTGGVCRIRARIGNVTVEVDTQTRSPSGTWWTRLTAEQVMAHTLTQVTPR